MNIFFVTLKDQTFRDYHDITYSNHSLFGFFINAIAAQKTLKYSIGSSLNLFYHIFVDIFHL